jgi:hypothetical protein
MISALGSSVMRFGGAMMFGEGGESVSRMISDRTTTTKSVSPEMTKFSTTFARKRTVMKIGETGVSPSLSHSVSLSLLEWLTNRFNGLTLGLPQCTAASAERNGCRLPTVIIFLLL